MGLFDNVRKAFASAPIGTSIVPSGGVVTGVRTQKVTITGEKGGSGTKNYQGFIQEDYNAQFNGQKAVATYDEMRRSDATINAVLTALKLPILAAERMIESADKDDEKENEIAEFVRKNLFEDIKFGQFLREALGHLDFGFWYFEKVYDVKDGMIVLKKLASRLPTAHYRWMMQSDPSTPGVTQLLPSTQPNDEDTSTIREIPMSKLVLFTNNKEGDNYEGVSVLRSAYKHWYMKDTFYRIDAIKHERGAGVLVITLPEGGGDEAMSDATQMGEYFKINEKGYIVLPSPNWKVELMTGGISDQSSGLMESVKHHDRLITMNILAQFLDLGSGSTGSYSLSRDQSDFFSLAIKAVAAYVEDVVNEQLIRELVTLNFGPREMYPKYKFSEIGDVDYTELSTVIEKLLNAGLVKNDPQLKVWIYKTFGLPDVTVEDFEENEDEKPPTPPAAEDDEDMPEDGPKEDGGKQEAPEDQELADGKYFRDLTLAEERVMLADVEDFFNKNEDEMRKILAAFSEQEKQALLKQIERIIDSGSINQVADMAGLDASDLTARLQELAKESLEKGKASAAREMDTAIPVTTNFTKALLKTKIDLFIAERAATITTAVKARLLDLMNNDVGKAAALFELEQIIDRAAKNSNESLVGKVTVDFFDEGRALTFEDMRAQLHGLQRSEILDDKTCAMCMSIDGRVLSPTDPFTKIGQIHTHCRGIWVGVLKTDAKLPQVKPLPKTLLSRFGRTDGVPATNDFKQIKNPVIQKGSRADQKIQDGDLEG